MIAVLILAASTAIPAQYRVPGDCFKVTTQDVRPDGSKAERIEVRCEFTAAIRARLAKEGK